MMESESLTLTVEEIATTKLAVRALRVLMSVGVGIALPMLIVMALPVVWYLLLASILLSPVLLGAIVLLGARRGAVVSS